MRTDAEVTAAAERTADLALRCAELTRQRDRARDIAVALEGQVAAVRALADDLWRVAPCGCGHRADLHGQDSGCIGGLTLCPCNRSFPSLVAERIRAALDPDLADRGAGERP